MLSNKNATIWGSPCPAEDSSSGTSQVWLWITLGIVGGLMLLCMVAAFVAAVFKWRRGKMFYEILQGMEVQPNKEQVDFENGDLEYLNDIETHGGRLLSENEQSRNSLIISQNEDDVASDVDEGKQEKREREKEQEKEVTGRTDNIDINGDDIKDIHLPPPPSHREHPLADTSTSTTSTTTTTTTPTSPTLVFSTKTTSLFMDDSDAQLQSSSEEDSDGGSRGRRKRVVSFNTLPLARRDSEEGERPRSGGFDVPLSLDEDLADSPSHRKRSGSSTTPLSPIITPINLKSLPSKFAPSKKETPSSTHSSPVKSPLGQRLSSPRKRSGSLTPMRSASLSGRDPSAQLPRISELVGDESGTTTHQGRAWRKRSGSFDIHRQKEKLVEGFDDAGAAVPDEQEGSSRDGL